MLNTYFNLCYLILCYSFHGFSIILKWKKVIIKVIIKILIDVSKLLTSSVGPYRFCFSRFSIFLLSFFPLLPCHLKKGVWDPNTVFKDVGIAVLIQYGYMEIHYHSKVWDQWIYFLNESNGFIQQECIKLIKRDNIDNIKIFQINAILLSVPVIKES